MFRLPEFVGAEKSGPVQGAKSFPSWTNLPANPQVNSQKNSRANRAGTDATRLHPGKE